MINSINSMNIMSGKTSNTVKKNFKNNKKDNTSRNSWGRNINNAFSVLEVIKIGNDDSDHKSETSDTETTDDFPLECSWILWAHDIDDKSWSIKSYKQLYTIKTASDFWKLFNNCDKIGMKFNHFYMMREGISPTWEDENNRDGGICSIKIESKNALSAFEEMSVKIVLEQATEIKNDINGISISPKNNWALIKLWNKDGKNDLVKTINNDIMDKYGHLSIKYKANKPEY